MRRKSRRASESFASPMTVAREVESAFYRQNDGNQRLATLRKPPEPILSRVRCIAWFWATSADSSGRGTASHSQQNRRKGDASYRTDRSDGDNDHVDVRIQPRAWARKTKEHHSENGDHCPHSAHEQVEQSLAWTP